MVLAMSKFLHHTILPPLKDRNKILDLYYKDLKQVDQIRALIKYKNLMHILYKIHNPWMRPVVVNKKNWFKN